MPMHGSASYQNTRRKVLQDSWLWLQLAALGALCYPVIKFIDFRAPKKPRYVKVFKDLQVGGIAVEHDFILFEGEEGPWAVSRKCTHLGCRLNFREKEDLLVCPCHQSRFTKAGKRVSGPAKRDLPRFPVERMAETEGKGYVVTL